MKNEWSIYASTDFHQAMSSDDQGASGPGGVGSKNRRAKSRSNSLASVIPASEAREGTSAFAPLLSAGNSEGGIGIFPPCSPDQQELPTRTLSWVGGERLTRIGETSRFFPADSVGGSEPSSTSTSGESSCDDENESAPDVTGSSTPAYGVSDCGTDSRGHGSAEHHPPEASKPVSLDDSSNTITWSSASQQDVVAEAKAVGAEVSGARHWSLRQVWTTVAVAVGALVLGIYIGSHCHQSDTVALMIPPTTAMTVFGQSGTANMMVPATETAADAIVPEVGDDSGDEMAVEASETSENKIVPQIGPGRFGEATAGRYATFPSKLDLHMRTVERVHTALEEMLEAWDAGGVLKPSADQEDHVFGLLERLKFQTNMVKSPPATGPASPSTWFSRMFNRLIQKYRPFFEKVLNGPWV